MAAYTGREALRGGFDHYRSLGSNAEQIRGAIACARFAMPTLAFEGGVVRATVCRQLEPVSGDFRRTAIEGCGHLIPLEHPGLLAEAIRDFAV